MTILIHSVSYHKLSRNKKLSNLCLFFSPKIFWKSLGPSEPTITATPRRRFNKLWRLLQENLRQDVTSSHKRDFNAGTQGNKMIWDSSFGLLWWIHQCCWLCGQQLESLSRRFASCKAFLDESQIYYYSEETVRPEVNFIKLFEEETWTAKFPKKTQ